MRADQLGANTSCLANLTLPQAVDTIRRLGFHGICLLAFDGARHRYGWLAGFWWPELSMVEREQLRALVADFQRKAVHAPFADLPLFTYNTRLAKLAHQQIVESIEAAGYLGASVVIVHANRRPNVPLDFYWPSMVQTFRELGEHAAAYGLQIAIETGFPDSVDAFARLVEEVDHPSVGANLDIGHLAGYVEPRLVGTPEGARQLNDRLAELCQRLGRRIVHCQVHDVSLADWLPHRAVGRGIIDVPRALACLDAFGYSGMLELELEEPDQERALVESRDRLLAWLRG